MLADRRSMLAGLAALPPATIDDVRRELEALISSAPRCADVSTPDTPAAVRRDLDALVGSQPENFRSVDQVGNSDVVPNYTDAGGANYREIPGSCLTEPASTLAVRTLHLRRQLAAAGGGVA